MTRSFDPRTGEPFGPVFDDASVAEVAAAARAAFMAWPAIADLDPAAKAALLDRIADALDEAGTEIVALAGRETALDEDRLTTELIRSTGQFRLLGAHVRSGDHLDRVIDGDPYGPARDLRRMNVPLGPVAVFGAANFPLAFGAAGGDTASAIAAGCPVIVKAHPAHPQASELVAGCLSATIKAQGLPAETYQLVHGASPSVGAALVADHYIKAVGFTGSFNGGRALFQLAATRPEPIPVFAEMGSLNPVLFAPSALDRVSLADIAAKTAASVAGSWGQFCTKPGLLLVPSHLGQAFANALVQQLDQHEPKWLLTEHIRDLYLARLAATRTALGQRLWTGSSATGGWSAPAAVGLTDAATLRSSPELREEHFGPFTLVVMVHDTIEVDDIMSSISGSLTATVHGSDADPWVIPVVKVFSRHAGRVLLGGMPTGVAVSAAQMHGGPYPASTSPAHSSVGPSSVRRFLRPVAFQDMPASLLPPPLRDGPDLAASWAAEPPFEELMT